MPEGRIRLSWWVDEDGYEIVRRKRQKELPPISQQVTLAQVLKSSTVETSDRPQRVHPMSLNEGLMPTGSGLLSGLAELGTFWLWPWPSDEMNFIVPRGGRRKEYTADLLEHQIFVDLANSAKAATLEGGVLQFVEKWGLLGTGDFPLEYFVQWRSKFIGAMENLRSSHDIVRRFNGRGLGRLGARFDYKNGKLQVYFQAETLQQFLLLELLQARAGHIDLTTCGACGHFLPLHKKGRTKEYCHDRCKQKAYRERLAS